MEIPSSNGDLQRIDHQQQLILGDSSSEDLELKAPKKRAETWVQDETRCLINFRRQVDALFNTSKSNKHLWEQIAHKMRDKGFDRSPTMCTDKWRNLLKEFKKVKQQDKGNINNITCGLSATKLWYYKELEELLRHRTKNDSYKIPHRHPPKTKIDGFIQFSDKGIDDGNVAFGSLEASNGPTSVGLDTRLDNDGDPLAITASEAIVASEVPPWNWRETPGTAGEGPPPLCVGRVITVKLGEYQRRIGIDGTADAIKETIKAAFGLRTKRAFWLVDEANIIRSIDRDMPLCSYTLHVDEGISIKVCFYDESDQMDVRTEEKTLYTEVDFHDFLARRGLIGLREMNDYRCFSNLDDLRPGVMYQGVRLVGD